MKANRYFYRIDGQNHPIPGTLVKLKEKPIIGKWKQVPSDECCIDPCLSEDITITDNIPNLSNGGCSITISLLVNGVPLGDLFIEPDTYATLTELINAINTYYNGVVIFTYSDPIMSATILGGSIYETATLNITTICE